MIDRDYLKFNTSIQTGSNAATTKTDEDGNIEATIELRLPDNIFSGGVGPKKIEKVRMQTSKMRLSLENTPIAQIPLDPEQTTADKFVSTCKLDIYPQSYTSMNGWQPATFTYADLPMNLYKTRTAFTTLQIRMGADTPNPYTVEVVGGISQCPDDPRNVFIYPFLDKIKFWESPANFWIPTNHEIPKREGDTALITSISTLQQMWQDLLEMRFMNGYITTSQPLNIVFHQRETPIPNHEDLGYIEIEGIGRLYLYSFSTASTTGVSSSTTLTCAPKTIVSFSEQTFSISYDTAQWPTTVPILWNPAFVNTYDYPPQVEGIPMTSSSTTLRPPAKRRYKATGYNGTSTSSYSFSIPNDGLPGVVNIMANKATTDVFSFLPWIKVPAPPIQHIAIGSATSTTYRATWTPTWTVNGNVTNISTQWSRDDETSVDFTRERRVAPALTSANHSCVEVTYKLENGVKTNIKCDYGSTVVYTATYTGTTTQNYTPSSSIPIPQHLTMPTDNDVSLINPGMDDLKLWTTPITLPILSNISDAVSSQIVYQKTQVQVRMPGLRFPYLTYGQGSLMHVSIPHDQDDVSFTSENWIERCYPIEAPTSTTVDTDGITHEIWDVGSAYYEGNYVLELQYIRNLNEHVYATVTYRGSTSSPMKVELTKTRTVITDDAPVRQEFNTPVAENGYVYLLDGTGASLEIGEFEPATIATTSALKGTRMLTFTWDNLPVVIMSPISSIVLTLQGVQVDQEVQPINIAQPTGSSLTSTIPVIENFYSLAQTLRDLHDELVVVKDSFDDTATYTVAAQSGSERTLHLSAKYITKDGTLHQIYIPPKGVFSVQLTFGISYYIS